MRTDDALALFRAILRETAYLVLATAVEHFVLAGTDERIAVSPPR
jgi:hypothetical protein